MTLRVQRRLAAEVLGVGENRIWMDPARKDEISTAITKEDIRKLIKKGIIRARQKKGTSRGRVRERRGKRRGPGSREGSKGAIEPRKTRWMRKVRALRKTLAELRDNGTITRSQYRKLYRMVKGGFFRDRGHLLLYLKEQGLVK
jgi:large subunit ribosomal protein L19e